ncbi:MAG: hypothetical protein JHC31_03375 [Sulfurihydrogenibium sp.]|jgi:Tfp pilus assembly protein PilO|nr:hypothetical protein [Sulfurihydrogenibium sp.]
MEKIKFYEENKEKIKKAVIALVSIGIMAGFINYVNDKNEEIEKLRAEKEQVIIENLKEKVLELQTEKKQLLNMITYCKGSLYNENQFDIGKNQIDKLVEDFKKFKKGGK